MKILHLDVFIFSDIIHVILTKVTHAFVFPERFTNIYWFNQHIVTSGQKILTPLQCIWYDCYWSIPRCLATKACVHIAIILLIQYIGLAVSIAHPCQLFLWMINDVTITSPVDTKQVSSFWTNTMHGYTSWCVRYEICLRYQL